MSRLNFGLDAHHHYSSAGEALGALVRAHVVPLRFLFLLILVSLTIRDASLCYASDKEDGFVSIFDGRTLEGWRGKSPFWSVQDGAITGETTAANPTEGNTFLIFKDEVDDFELRISVKILSGNSGIQYRSVARENFVVHGYQADVDTTERYLGDLYDEGGRGILAKGGDRGKIGADGRRNLDRKLIDRRALSAAIRWGDWNDYTVIAQGNRLIQRINGLDTIDLIDDEAAKSRDKGLLALQLHAGPPMFVQFKDIRLKRLR